MSKNNNPDKTYLTKERKENIILKLTEAKISILERQSFTKSQINQFEQKIKYLIDGLEKDHEMNWVAFAILNVQDYVFELRSKTVSVFNQQEIFHALTEAIFQGYYTKEI